MSDLSKQINDAKSQIKAGFYAALFSLVTTLIITLLGATDTADLGLGADWYMLFDVLLIAIFAFGIWKRSRTATTAMFIYFAISKVMMLAAGQFSGIIMGVILLFFYGRAMIASYRYHTLLKNGGDQAAVF